MRSAERARSSIAAGLHDPVRFCAALLEVPATERDAWLDLVLGLDDHYDDGPDLPPGGVPYLPCAVEVLLRVIQHAPVGPSDVVVDLGSGPGRAIAFLHLMTGAGAVGIEVQPQLVRAARDLASRLGLARIPTIHGDAAAMAGFMMTGSVFFLYCPFSGARLQTVLAALEAIAATRQVRICCVGLPPLTQPWLTREPGGGEDLLVYRSVAPRRQPAWKSAVSRA